MRPRSKWRLWIVAAFLVLSTRANPVIADIPSATTGCQRDASLNRGGDHEQDFDSCNGSHSNVDDAVWQARQPMLAVRGSGVIGINSTPASSGIKHSIVQAADSDDLDTAAKSPLLLPMPAKAQAASGVPTPPSASQVVSQTDDITADLGAASQGGADKSDAIKPKISYGGQHSSVGITGGSKKSSPGLTKGMVEGAAAGDVLDPVLPAELHGVASNQTSTVWNQSPAHQPSPSASPVPESDTMGEGMEPDANPTGSRDEVDAPSNSSSSNTDGANPRPRFEHQESQHDIAIRTGPHRLDQERPLLSAVSGWKQRAPQVFHSVSNGPEAQSLTLRDAIVELGFATNSSSPSR